MRVARDADDDDDENRDDPEQYPDGVYADEPGTLPCPYCKKEISELAEICPHCKSYISFEDVPPEPKPLWFVITSVLLILVFSGVAVMLLFGQ